MNKENSFIIEGPISYYYLESKQYKKNIMLFSDIHYEFKKYESDINLLNFFYNIIGKNEEKKGCLDIFIESPFFFKSKEQSVLKKKNNEKNIDDVAYEKNIFNHKVLFSSIRKSLNLLINKQIKLNSTRIHDMDTRSSIITLKFNKATVLDQLCHPLIIGSIARYKGFSPDLKSRISQAYFAVFLGGLEKKISLTQFAEVIFDLLSIDLFDDDFEFDKYKYNYDYLYRILYIIFDGNEMGKPHFNKDHLKDTLKRIRRQFFKIKDKELRNKIKKEYERIICQEINLFLFYKSDIFDKASLLKKFNEKTIRLDKEYFNDRKDDEINEIIFFRNLLALQMDIYSIIRMHRSFDQAKNKMKNCDKISGEIDNILYYAGDAHFRNVYKILSNLGYEITNHQVKCDNKKYKNKPICVCNVDKSESFKTENCICPFGKSSKKIENTNFYGCDYLFSQFDYNYNGYHYVKLPYRDYLGFTKDEMREIVNNRYFIKDKMCGNFNISSEDKTKYKYYLAKKVGAFYKYNKNEVQQFETVKNMPIIKCEYV